MPIPPRIITHDGLTLTLSEWAKRTGIPAETIRSRVDKQGWPTSKALTTPIRAKFNPRKSKPLDAPRPCPQLKRHEPTGRAYCRWMVGGKEHWRYFGDAGTAEAAAAYRRFQMEWAARGAPPPPDGDSLYVCELAEQYLAHVDRHYVKDGKPTSERHTQRAAIGVLVELYPDVKVAEFRASHLRAVVAAMVARGWSRKTINGHKWRVTNCFAWGVGQDLVPPDVPARLKHVENLERGRTTAPEYPKVGSAPVVDVEATIPHLHPQPNRQAVLEAMVRTHLLVGCRPHELCAMTADAIDRAEGDLWCFRYSAHKNLHREQAAAVKRIWIGTRAQAVMRPYLDAAGAAGRVWVLPPLGEGTRSTPVSRGLYGRLVAAACKAAQVTPWTPHQLRHTRATEVERVYESNKAAAAAIGDSERVAAEVYVDPNEAVARRIARELG